MPEYATPMTRWFGEVWNSRHEEAIDELLDDDVVIHNLEENVNGKNEFKQFYHQFTSAFPTLNVNIDSLIRNDEFEAAYCNVKGTAADGSEVDFNGIVIGKFRNGKLIEGWNAFDFLTMHKQLGEKLVKAEMA